MELTLVLFVGFIAGAVDALAGGGGMVQVPALLMIFPNALPVTILASSKVASFSGTITATLSMLRRLSYSIDLVLYAGGSCLVTGVFGAHLASILPVQAFKPVASILLLMAIVSSLSSSRGQELISNHVNKVRSPKLEAILIGSIGGLYDGFFGPGLGTILILLFVSRLSLSYLEASLHAKILNVLSNGGALIYFISHGHVQWNIAVPLACANLLGALLGSRLAMLKGNVLIRRAVGVMSLLIVLKLSGEWLW